jgi:HPt (histidine-containing phosphotransfer) domain-containing protein
MAKSRNDAPTVQTFADHEVIVPVHKLQRAMTTIGNDIGPDLDAIARAEAALAELSSEFTAWMKAECERLDAARQRVRQAGLNSPARDPLFRAAHDIKGEAATFGYPLAAEVADSLCRLLEHAPQPERIPFTLVEQHVDGIRAISRDDARECWDTVGAEMVSRLRQVTDEFLVAVNKHRPEYLDGIVASSPSIAPEK